MTTYVDGIKAAKAIVEKRLEMFPDDIGLVEVQAILVSVIELETNLYEKDMIDDFE